MPQPRRRRHGTPARPPARARTARRFPGGLHRGADARERISGRDAGRTHPHRARIRPIHRVHAEMQASATDVLRNLIALNQAR